MEIWNKIAGFNGRYEISNYGRVRSNDMVVNGRKANCHKINGRILKPYNDKDGYKCVILCVNQKRTNCRVHRLVAMAFISNPDGLPEIDHINGEKTDNRVENLRWATRVSNSNNPITRQCNSLAKKGILNPNYHNENKGM